MTICMHPAERAVCVPTEQHLCIVTELKRLSALICRYLSAELRQVLEDWHHYDYWDDKIRRSILFDSRASILMYGMGEKQIVRIADKLRDGVPVNEITDIPGTCYISSEYDEQNSVLIPSYEECVESKSKYAVSCRLQYYEQNPYIGKTLVQKHGDQISYTKSAYAAA